MTSDWPCVLSIWGTGYISALSKKLMPSSEAVCSSTWASAADVLSPKSMVPAPMQLDNWLLHIKLT